MIDRVKHLKELKERLQTGKLNQEDRTQLADLVSKAEEAATIEATSAKTSDGRKLIARLPYGLDVVK